VPTTLQTLYVVISVLLKTAVKETASKTHWGVYK